MTHRQEIAPQASQHSEYLPGSPAFPSECSSGVMSTHPEEAGEVREAWLSSRFERLQPCGWQAPSGPRQAEHAATGCGEAGDSSHSDQEAEKYQEAEW